MPQGIYILHRHSKEAGVGAFLKEQKNIIGGAGVGTASGAGLGALSADEEDRGEAAARGGFMGAIGGTGLSIGKRLRRTADVSKLHNGLSGDVTLQSSSRLRKELADQQFGGDTKKMDEALKKTKETSKSEELRGAGNMNLAAGGFASAAPLALGPIISHRKKKENERGSTKTAGIAVLRW